MSAAKRPPTALIGAGALARALAPLLLEAGYSISAVASKGSRSARRLARRLGGACRPASPADAARSAKLVLLAVPDSAIAPLASELARMLGDELRGRVAIHHAGSLGLEVLRPLARADAAVGLMHPMQSFADPDIAAEMLPGSTARIEGDSRGVAAARRLARDLGLAPLALPGRSTARDRELYHAAASMVSNDLIALIGLAAGVLERSGLERRRAVKALLPLVRGTLAQAEAAGLERALTGPVARGDRDTLAAHLRRLHRASPAGARVHRLLSRELIEIASSGGRLSPAQRSDLRALLRDED